MTADDRGSGTLLGMWSDEVERVLGPDPVADVGSISVAEIRVQRDECRRVEDKVSYLRRLVQGRLDIVEADLRRRADGTSPGDLPSLVEQLPGILSDRVRGPGTGPGRLPTSISPPDDDDLLAELDAVASPGALDSLSDLSDDEVQALAAAYRRAGAPRVGAAAGPVHPHRRPPGRAGPPVQVRRSERRLRPRLRTFRPQTSRSGPAGRSTETCRAGGSSTLSSPSSPS